MPLRPHGAGAVALAFASLAASAQTGSTPPLWPAIGEPQSLATDPVGELHLGPQSVVFTSTTLGQLRDAVGLGQVIHHGRGTEALDWLCYTLGAAQPAQRLWLTSSELAGGGKIDGVAATELRPGEHAVPACPELPARFAPVRFEEGLWLGPLDADQRRSLGVAAHGSALWSGQFHGTLGGLDTVTTLVVEVRHGRAVSLHAARD